MIEEKTTYCRVCEVYCGLVATVEDGRVTALRPDRDHVVSRGYCCPKGVTFHHVTHDPDRILHPLKRTPDGWQRIGWEQAIGEIGAKLNAIRTAHGPDAIALYTGNPAGYSYSHTLSSGSWLKAIGSRNGYGAGSQDNLSIFVAAKFLYGSHLRVPVPDLDRTRYLLIVGSNPVISQGTMMHAVDAKGRLEAVRARGGKVVVIDPRRTETARIADEHHFITPDRDAFFLLAMLQVVLGEGLEDGAFLAEHANDLEWLRAAVAPFTPELAAAETGIAAAVIRRLARELAAARGGSVYGRVVCGSFGTLAAWAIDVLNVVTGNLDRPGGAVFSDGIVDMAATVKRLGLDEYGEHRSRVAGLPGVLGQLPSGVLADEITTTGPGQIRALVVTAGNPVVSIANGPALADAMRELECTVVLDIQMSETAALADYVLPCTTALEREDFPIFHANLCTEPYIQWTEPMIPPQGEARSEWEIFVALGDAMGLRFLDDRFADLIRGALRLVGGDFSQRWLADAMIRTGPYGDGYLPWSSGWNVSRLAAEKHGVRLGAIRTGILREKLLTPDHKIALRRPEIEAEMQRLRGTAGPQAAAASDYPFRLIGRRDHRSNNSWLRNVPKLMTGERCRRLRVHPDDAASLGLVDGGRARVRSRVGMLEVDVRVTDEVMPGVVSLPHGWSELATERRVADAAPGPNCNALIDHRAIEPLAGMALLNGFPVAVEAAG